MIRGGSPLARLAGARGWWAGWWAGAGPWGAGGLVAGAGGLVLVGWWSMPGGLVGWWLVLVAGAGGWWSLVRVPCLKGPQHQPKPKNG